MRSFPPTLLAIPMLNAENYATAAIFLFAIGILAWGYYRNRSYGRMGLLAWFQSVALMLPWLVFFGSFAAGIYVNLAVVLLLLVSSTALYIWLGNRLRAAAQDPELGKQMAERMNRYRTPDGNGTVPEVATVPEIPHIEGDELEKIRGIFGIDTFFATKTIPYQNGVLFQGNLRGEPAAAHQRIQQNLQKLTGDKYQFYLLEGPEERPVALVMPLFTESMQMTGAQKILSVVLLVATIASTLETAGVFLGFDFYANLGRWQQVVPLAAGLWSILVAHEIGHWLTARKLQVKLNWPSFLPTAQIGSFGAITRFASTLPDRTALFDIAIAGPIAGGLVSLGFLLMGLVLSRSGNGVEIPSQFFQASILVGSLAKVVLGSEIHKNLVNISPLVVLGWLGLVITALNLMPAGQLDGGRMMQAIYGRKVAQRSTIATLVILAIVAFANPANSVILYWAVLIGFLQRTLEKPCLNELTEPDDTRAALMLLALFLSIAILIPFSPDLAGRFGIGG
jgi:membrane-associated protease RseP (regulator of RpoE activity)